VVVTSSGSLTYTENDPATVIDSGVTVSDADSPNLVGATVQITTGCANGQDVLAFANTATITGTFTAATCSMVLSGSASVSDYQAALRTVTYVNTSNNPSTAARTVTFSANDGTQSGSATRGITVVAVNDAPVLTAGGTLNYTENQAPTAIDGTITVTDVDSPNLVGATIQITGNYATGQDVLSYVTALGISGTFNASSGTLTLTGSATVANYQTALRNVLYANTSNDPSPLARTVTWQVNDGAAANNLSNTPTSTINVTAVNDPPTAFSFSNLPAQAGIPITYPAGKLGGTDVEAGTTITINTTPDSTTGGSVVINADGSFTFTPLPTTASGSASFTYHVSDNGKPPPGANSAPATVSFSVAGPEIYFVKNTAVGAGNCTLGAECTLSTALTDIGARTNTRIYINDGITCCGNVGVTLNFSGWLIGQGVTNITFDTLFGISAPAQGTLAARPSLGGPRPTLTGANATVTVNTNSAVRGLDINVSAGGNAGLVGSGASGVGVTDLDVTSATGAAISLTNTSANFTNGGLNVVSTTGTGFSVTGGTVNVTGTGNTISASGATALLVNGGTLGATFDSVTSSGGTTNLSLTNLNGTLTMNGGSLSGTTAGATNHAVVVSGGTGTITYAGSVTKANQGNLVNVSAKTAGSVTFSGALNGTGSTGVSLANNTGATVTFSGGLTLSTGASPAFAATGGGTVNVTGSANTLTTTTATALNVSNTTIGSSGLTFLSISAGTSAGGPANGIVLNATGSSGGLTVTGDGNTSVGGDGSGGILQHTTSYAISVANTLSPSFTNVTIHDIPRNGIDGTLVTNFTFKNGQVTNTGTAVAGQFEENAIAFVDRTANPVANTITGAVVMTGNLISAPHRNAIMIETWGNGTISNLNISSNTLTGASTTLSTTADIADAIHVLSQGSATTSSQITTGTINNNTISGFEFLSGSINVGGNGILVGGGSGNGTNTTVTTIGAAATPIEISGNDVDNVGINGIEVSFNGQQGLSNFNIHNNGTVANPMSNMEGLGISVFFGGSGTFSALVNSNAVNNNGPTVNAGSAGIAVQLDDGPAGLANATGTANITVNSNTVTNPDGFGLRGIVRNSNGVLNLKMQNNNVGTPRGANREAIRIDGNTVTTGNTTMCLNMTGNSGPLASTTDNLVGSGVDAGIGVRKQGTVQATNAFGINDATRPAGTLLSDAQLQAAIGRPTNATADGISSVNGVDIISGTNYQTCKLP
jgi:hypothetical protein